MLKSFSIVKDSTETSTQAKGDPHSDGDSARQIGQGSHYKNRVEQV
jgi:hypothetical protein